MVSSNNDVPVRAVTELNHGHPAADVGRVLQAERYAVIPIGGGARALGSMVTSNSMVGSSPASRCSSTTANGDASIPSVDTRERFLTENPGHPAVGWLDDQLAKARHERVEEHACFLQG